MSHFGIPEKHAALKNSFFGVGTRSVSGFSRIAVMLLIAKSYGPALFGKVALAMSIMEIFRTFSEFGLDTVSLRRFSQTVSRDEHAQLFASLVPLKMAAAGVFYVASLLALAILGGGAFELKLGAVAGLSLFSANLVGILNSYYQSQLRMSNVFLVAVAAYGTYVTASVIAMRTQVPLTLILALLPLVETAYFLVLYRSGEHRASLDFNVSGTMELFKESLPLGLMSAMVLLYLRLDNVVIFKMLGSEPLGLYAACVRLVEPVLMVPGAFAATLLALLSNNQRERTAPRNLLKLSWHAMWPAYLFTVLAVVGFLVAGNRVLLRFGQEYTPAYPALCILALSLAVRAVNATLSTIINSRGGYSILAKVTAVNLLVNIILIFLLVPSLGITGAALAVLGTELWNMLAQSWSMNTLLRSYSGDMVALQAMDAK